MSVSAITAVSADDHYQHWYMYPYRVIDNCPSKTVSGMWHKITPFRINGNLEQKLAVKTAFIGPNFSLFPKILKIRQSHYQPAECCVPQSWGLCCSSRARSTSSRSPGTGEPNRVIKLYINNCIVRHVGQDYSLPDKWNFRAEIGRITVFSPNLRPDF